MTKEGLLQVIQKAGKDKVTRLDLSHRGLTSLPPEIGQFTNLQSLDLSGNKLSSLPGEFGQLTNLQVLDLRRNQLSSLPGEFGQLTNLQVLDLRRNQLSSLPGEFVQLTDLQSLDFSDNQLSNLPREIGQLTNLQTLYLSENQLSNLPGEIGKLTSLQTLHLWDNQLSSLPGEFGQLTDLQSLHLHSNQLSSLPGEIGKLTKLQSLDLRSNQLSSLPGEIGQLTKLQSLDLRSNQLSSLLGEIGQLTKLQSLYISENQLTSLPAEIGQLTKLQSLYISENQLTSLPAEIGQLTKLQYLYLHSNQLTSLPAEIAKLSNLKYLALSENKIIDFPPEITQLRLKQLTFLGNTLASIPPEIYRKGFEEILNFYKQLEQETDRLYEAKLLIVGEAGAGKTTLAKKIQDPNYQLQQDEISTEGIDVIQWKFLLKNEKEFRVNIWDFGGQEIYHATHQFFLTKRSLYALVVDTRKEDTDFYYWLNVVELLSENSPLLIVKNEKQERKREINEQQLRGEFTNLKETLPTNLATNRGLPEILINIQHYISNLSHIGTKLPKTWIKVRKALEQNSRDHISLEEYLHICQENGFTNREDKLQLSGYLHDLGVCLHFQEDDLLRKTVILKPTWGTDAVYKVLDNPQVVENFGKFNRNDLANIWHEDKYTDMQPELLRLMMNFKLCYEIPSSPGTYIAPQFLNPNQPDYIWNETDNLLLRYEYEFMPKGILTRFIVEMHQWIEEQTCVWRTGVVLSKDEAKAEVIEYYHYHKGEIRIRVSGKRKRDLLTTVRYELNQIHDSYERLKYKTLVPCNCQTCKGSQTPQFYPLNVLHKFIDHGQQHIQCQNSFEMVNVRGLIDDVVPEPPRSKSYENDVERRDDRNVADNGKYNINTEVVQIIENSSGEIIGNQEI
ncbi:MAG: COR domain-containing protein [Calothrix sp. MO_167.B12]|nr:COR domain-containing protein [Calothrix sp. MO_167.B12]